MSTARQVREHIQYHSYHKCVVCDNPDFTRYEFSDNAEPKIIQEHKLNHIHLNSKVIVFCNSCLFDLKHQLTQTTKGNARND
ncbi:MAG TPA: hypothetical protein VLE02_05130 [Nitrosarchaeum sp.]|nr:hypothetical protein [Nitrosarchaeum sp.]